MLWEGPSGPDCLARAYQGVRINAYGSAISGGQRLPERPDLLDS